MGKTVKPDRNFRVAMRGGRWRYFAEREAAYKFAGDIFRRRGVVVAVEAVPKGK